MSTALGSLLQCPTTLVKNLFMISNLSLLFHSSMLFPQVLSLSPERDQRCLSTPASEKRIGCHAASPQPSLLWAEQTKRPQHSSHPLPSRLFTIFVAFFWTLCNSFMSFSDCGAQKDFLCEVVSSYLIQVSSCIPFQKLIAWKLMWGKRLGLLFIPDQWQQSYMEFIWSMTLMEQSRLQVDCSQFMWMEGVCLLLSFVSCHCVSIDAWFIFFLSCRCGKTTQIPQFILDASLQGSPNAVANIICTQPRRISAISVAERVAKERTERVGVTVGYQIRLESVKVCMLCLLVFI